MENEKLIELRNLTKVYPGVVANDDVSFSIEKGSIHALLGENGAGKSTLVKMIYGLVQPSKGTIIYQNQNFSPDKPQTARAAGIGMVFQHFSLFDALSVAENIEVGMENAPHREALSRQIEQVSKQYGLPLDPRLVVGVLSAGERQRVEIVRCLLQSPKLLIMDEPTSVLTPQEVETLFVTLRKLRDEGVSILYISHKLEEIRSLCDAATILRRGKVVGSCDPRKESAKSLAEMMVGEKLIAPSLRNPEFGDVVLSAKNLGAPPLHEFGPRMREVNFEVRSGEILGVAGVAGNGQDEILAFITGETQCFGEIWLDGKNISNVSTKHRREMGVIGAPEERNGHAAVPKMSLVENAMLTAQSRAELSKGNWLDWVKARDYTKSVIARFDVRTPSENVAAGSLSGGNLQKFVIGREIMQNPRLFIVNQPTWGVDAAAAAFIREAIRELANSGAAVVVISQDLDELFELSDSLCALCEGRMSPKFAAKDMNMQKIGSLMGGEF